jgi:hypothetical protein
MDLIACNDSVTKFQRFSLSFQWGWFIISLGGEFTVPLATITEKQSGWTAVSGTVSGWIPNLVQGPYWGSFEQFRTSGSSSLDGIRPGMVATLSGKSATFRILRDDDFQKLLGLSSEVYRIKNGITFVVQAAKIVAKHKDQESLELLFRSVSMLGESPILPEREGHDQFQITERESTDNAEDGFDVNAVNVPRPL